MPSEACSEVSPGKLTYEDIARVCGDLRALGEFGVRDVHRRLGRGSMTSITRMVRQWRTAKTEEDRAARDELIPVAMRDILATALVEARDAGRNEAKGAVGLIEDERDALAEALTVAEEGRAQHADALSQLEQISRRQQAEAAQAQARHDGALERADRRIEALESQCAQANDRLRQQSEGEGARQAQWAAAQQQIARLQAELLAASERLRTAHSGCQAAQARAAEAECAAAVAAEQSRHLERRAAAAISAHAAAQKQIDALNTRIQDALHARAQALDEQAQAAQAQLLAERRRAHVRRRRQAAAAAAAAAQKDAEAERAAKQTPPSDEQPEAKGPDGHADAPAPQS